MPLRNRSSRIHERLFWSSSLDTRLEAFMRAFRLTERTRVRRHAGRGVYDMDEIYSILDEGYVCDLGFIVGDQPYVIPTAYGRSGNQIYIHASAASRTVRWLGDGIDACATVSLVDGFVLARSIPSLHSGLLTLPGRMALRSKIGSDEAEPEGVGGSKVEDRNDV
jgi:hypothetical protein